MKNSVQFKMAYNNSDQSRQYTIDDVADVDAIASDVRQRAKNFNTYLTSSASTPVFVDSDGNAAKAISDVKIISVEERVIEGV